MQTGDQQILIKDAVRVTVPQKLDITSLISASGFSHPVTVENGDRVVWVSREDATALLTSGTANSTAWTACNRELAQQLYASKPLDAPSISWSDWVAANSHYEPRHLFDRGGFVNDALRDLGILR